MEFRNSIVAEKSHGAIEFRVARKNSTLRYIQGAEGVVLNEKQEVIRVLGVNIDVTERKKTKHKIQEQANLLGLASDAIIVRGLDEDVQYWNKVLSGSMGGAPRRPLAQTSLKSPGAILFCLRRRRKSCWKKVNGLERSVKPRKRD